MRRKESQGRNDRGSGVRNLAARGGSVGKRSQRRDAQGEGRNRGRGGQQRTRCPQPRDHRGEEPRRRRGRGRGPEREQRRARREDGAEGDGGSSRTAGGGGSGGPPRGAPQGRGARGAPTGQPAPRPRRPSAAGVGPGRPGDRAQEEAASCRARGKEPEGGVAGAGSRDTGRTVRGSPFARFGLLQAWRTEEPVVSLEEDGPPRVSTIPPRAPSHRHRGHRNRRGGGAGSSAPLGDRPSAASEHAHSPRSRGSLAGGATCDQQVLAVRPRPRPLGLPSLPYAPARALPSPRLGPAPSRPAPRPSSRFRAAAPTVIPRDLSALLGSRSQAPARTGDLRQ
nr:uncharacterized protein LOC116279685 [Vicugna pacos]